MMKVWTSVAVMMSVWLSAHAWAQESPVGLWKTIDDDTKQEKGLVRITENNGVLTGKLEKVLDPTRRADELCLKCTDERKDKPVVGMTLIRNVKQSTKNKGIWEDGDILDPNNGKVYTVRLRPIEDGKKLEVRGYIAFFYRNQTWIRAE
jgi:uncharacterized protein (DUF2147 family)